MQRVAIIVGILALVPVTPFVLILALQLAIHLAPWLFFLGADECAALVPWYHQEMSGGIDYVECFELKYLSS
jgi:hypothetical protein